MRFPRKQPTAWIALGILTATGATAQAPPVDLSNQTVTTVVPSEFDGGFLHRVVEIVVTDSGIWVVDVGQPKLFQFDHTGRLVVEYGRQGAGQGEFLLPGGLRADSVVTVIDQRQQRVVRFALDGDHLETRRVRGPEAHDMNVPVGWLAVLRNGVIATVTVGWYAFGADAVSNPFNHVLLEYPGVPGADTIATYHFGRARWQTASRMSVFNPRFGTGGAWAVAGDSAIVVVDGVTGSVVLLTARGAGRPANASDIGAWFAVDTVSLGISARPVSRSDRASAETDLRRERDLPARIEIDGWPEHWSVATQVLVADDGKVWALQVMPDDDRQHWTVADPHTLERLRFVLPERFRLLAIAGGKLYGVALDELDVQSIGTLQLR